MIYFIVLAVCSIRMHTRDDALVFLQGLAEDNFNEGNVQYQNAVGHKVCCACCTRVKLVIYAFVVR